MGFIKRKSSTAGKVSLSDFEAKRAQFLFDIQVLVMITEIPNDLIMYHTGLHYVPILNWTMAKDILKQLALTINDN